MPTNPNKLWLETIQSLSQKMKVDVELFIQRNSSRRFGTSEGKPHLQTFSSTTSYCLRVLTAHRSALLTSSNLTVDSLSSFLERAVSLAKISPEDPNRIFADPSSSHIEIPYDKGVFTSNPEERISFLLDKEKDVLKFDPRIKKIVRFQIQENLESKTILNSKGLSVTGTTSGTGFVGEVLAEGNGQSEVAWDYVQVRFAEDLYIDRTIFSIGQNAVRSLGGKPISSGVYPVLVLPRVGVQFWSLLTQALSADSVAKGKSYFKSRKLQKIAPEMISFIDDPLLPRGVSSSSFDDEGVSSEKFNPIEEGVLVDYFYDLSSAKKEGRKSNGRGSKKSLEQPPSPGPTNFYLKPGIKKVEELISSRPKVFVLHDVLGLHMCDPSTGEFSLGASGHLYENGKYVHAVRGITVAGQISDLLKAIIMVGDDLQWYGALGSPSFLVEPMMISGS